MSLYANKLLSYANRTGGIGLVPRGYDRAKLRRFLAKSLAGMADRVEAMPDSDGLWAHQVETLRAIADRVGDLGRAPAGIVVIPTGGGKTEVFQRVVDATHLVAPDGRRVTPNTIVLVPTLNLIEQTATRFVDHFPHLSEHVGVIGSDIVRDLSGSRGVRPVTVMSYEGFVRSVLGGGLTVDDVHLLVMDEAHRALSDLRRDVFAPFVERCATLAFSATPGFDEDRNLFDLFGPGSEIVNVPAHRLRDDGIIAPAVNYVLKVRIEGEMPGDADAALRVKRSAVARAIVDFRAGHVDPVTGLRLADKPMLAFMRDTSHSLMARDAFNAARDPGAGPVEVISGYDDPDVQSGKLLALRTGRIAGLLNTRLLGEGSDIPEVGAVFMSPTSSALQVAQVGGRAVRMDPRWPGDDVRQTAYIVNTVIEVNGREVGRTVPYWKAIDDYSIARPVDLPVVRVEDVEILGEPDEDGIETDDAWDDGQAVAPAQDPAPAPAAPPMPSGTDRPTGATEPMAEPGGAHAVRYGIAHRENMFKGLRARSVAREHRGWRDAFGMLKLLAPQTGRDRTDDLLHALAGRTLAAGGPTHFELGSLSVSTKVVAGPDGDVVLFSDDSVPSLRRMLDFADAPITAEWCIRREILYGKWVVPETVAVMNEIEDAFLARRRAGDDEPLTWSRALVKNGKNAAEAVRFVDIPPVSIRMDVRSGERGPLVCYHRDSLQAIRSIVGLAADVPAKTDGWLDRKEVAVLLGGRSPATDAVFRALERAYEARERAGETSVVVEHGVGRVTMSRRATSKTSKPVCYAEASLGEFRRILGRGEPAPPKTGRDLSYKDLARRLGVHPSLNVHLRAIRDEVMAEHAETGSATVDGTPVAVGVRRNSMRDGFYWDESSVEVVREAIEARKLEQEGMAPSP